MNSEKRLLLATVLSFLVFVGWYFVFKPVSDPIGTPTSSSVVSQSPTPANIATAPNPSETPKTIPTKLGESDVVSLPQYTLSFQRQGAWIDSFELNDFQKQVLVKKGEEAGLILTCEACNFSLPDNIPFELKIKGPESLVYEWESNELRLRRTYQFSPDRHLIDASVEIEARKAGGLTGRLGLVWIGATDATPMKGGFLGGLQRNPRQQDIVYLDGDKVFRHTVKKEALSGSASGGISWAGIEDRYFLRAIVSRGQIGDQPLTYQLSPNQTKLTVYTNPFAIPAGDKKSFEFSAFVGPKWYDKLKDLGIGLEKTIDYGWFSVLALPILWLLKWFHGLIPNWGLAIILMTLTVKLLMNPLTVKGLKQMKGMQNLQPEMKLLKEKFKDDKQRLNTEMMNLFKRHKVNPVGGCLPMLMQFPIYIALYRVLFNSIELYQAPFFGFYKDLSIPDPYFIMPVVLGIFMFLQQKLTPNPSADPAQAKMMMIFMPLMMTTFMLFLPVGLVLYILVNTVMSVLQQYMYTHDIKWRDLLRGRFAPKSV